MTVSREVEVEIQRLAHAEGWAVGTIASELGVHHEVVERVLDAEHAVAKERPPRGSKLDPYKPFVNGVLEKHVSFRQACMSGRGTRGSVSGSTRHDRSPRGTQEDPSARRPRRASPHSD